MKQYNNLSEIILDKDNYPNAGRVFIEKSKLNDMKNSNYWIISSQESRDMDYIEDERGNQIPVILKDFNVKRLLDVQTFQDIIDLKIENNPNIKLGQTDVFFEAIMYYLENDDFMD
jgi:hypothetical protein